ncbi:MAG: DUF6377 domain-containing protein [Alistipes sp.]|nr:DUF6377 domain-containing protein [Alistipes sp.]
MNTVDSLLLQLDRSLESRWFYEAEKEARIDSARQWLSSGLTPFEQYKVNKRLIELYRSYSYEPAMLYVMRNRTLAEDAGDIYKIVESQLDYSNLLSSGGMYKEAIENLAAIDRQTVPEELLSDYFLCCEQVYHHLSMYAAGTTFGEEYNDISLRYVDSLRMVVPEGSDKYFALSRIYITNPNKRLAIAMLQDMLDRLEPGTHGYAIVASTLADCYDESDPAERELRKQYLISSAISDIGSSVKEYVSLTNLAALLYAEGDVGRAYRYGTISMEDANFYNARLRRIEMSTIFPIIERAYKSELDQKNSRLKRSILMISLLAVLMLSLIIYVTRQTFILRTTRQALIRANDQLVETNRSLVVANKMKEEYLGRFLSMCSSYINRLERYQSTINNKLTAGKVEEVRIMTRSSNLISHEISEFYRSFDKAFLRIYPDFVGYFNALLRDGEQIEPKTGELLTTEMRIYALVKLGITDSASISKFLRYSPNTVYTYRHKVRAKAKNKDTFEEDIRNMGF